MPARPAPAWLYKSMLCFTFDFVKNHRTNERIRSSDETDALLDRKGAIGKLTEVALWDVIIIGGGATGLGVAVDAATRGFKTLLLEQSDFAKGTSSRSTKLVHGGVRYLAQGNIGLVYSALHERGLLLNNAPHIVRKQSFIIPCYTLWDKIQYLIGLKLYDLLSGRFSFGRSNFRSPKEMQRILPAIKATGLRGGIEYYDGQFDDARLAINLAQTSKAHGGVPLNYTQVVRILKTDGKVTGVAAIDLETNKEYLLYGKAVVNATGVFVDDVLQMDSGESRPMVRPSQGVHLVFDRSFLNSSHAVMIPKTADGRVLFAVPWHDHVLVGTTDSPIDHHSLEPVPLEKEIEFILQTVDQYFSRKPSRKDVLSMFAGLRPLAAPQRDTDSTKEISRDHKLMVGSSGLITITGGKWTTYRKMAEETTDAVIRVASLENIDCRTKQLPIHGSSAGYVAERGELSVYGSDEAGIRKLSKEDPELSRPLANGFPFIKAQVIWAVRHEMARTVEDVLARRLRVLFLDARAAMDMAPEVARLMASELGNGNEWEQTQVSQFNALTNNYLLQSPVGKKIS